MTLINMNLVGEFTNAESFLRHNLNPLTINGLIKIFEIPEKVFEDYISKNNFNKDETAIFNYLLDEGYSDEEIIKHILTKEKKKYVVDVINEDEVYFKIFEVYE